MRVFNWGLGLMRTSIAVCLALCAASAGMAQLAIHTNPVPKARTESASMNADRAETNQVAQELGFDQAGSGSPLGTPGGPAPAPAAAPQGLPLIATAAEGAGAGGQDQMAASGARIETQPLPLVGAPPGKRIEISAPIPDRRAWHAHQWRSVLASSTAAERQIERANERKWWSEQATERAMWAMGDAQRARAERCADALNEARWRCHGAVSPGRPTYALR